jgi:hypothetical protein
MAVAPGAGASALTRLLHKYGALAELRRARARGEPIPGKAVFLALAEEFPGALHELDRLPMEVIEARREALSAALRGGPEEPWMAAVAGYHALYRAALFVKARVKKDVPPSAPEAAEMARRASRHAGVEVGAAFVQAVARPERGRIRPVVLAEVAARTGQAEEAVREALFPGKIEGKARDDG